jgi:hypothetical protein
MHRLVRVAQLEEIQEEMELDPSDEEEADPSDEEEADPSDDEVEEVPAAEADAPAAEAEEDDERERPSIDLVKVEVLRIFKDLSEFDLDELMENEDDFSRFSRDLVEQALDALAQIQPPILIITRGDRRSPLYRCPP